MGFFKPAVRSQAFLRLALVGPSGCGKTYTSLALASALGERPALIDTERASAALYAGGARSQGFSFAHACLDTFSPKAYVDAIEAAEKERFDVLIIDSLSHAWFGEGGVLDTVDQIAAASKTHNTFGAWRNVTPQHNRLVDAILQFRGHVICTMRAKSKYVQQEKEDRAGRAKTEVVKVGVEAIQRDGIEYEFTMVGDMEALGPGHVQARLSKSRCPHLPPGTILENPGRREAEILRAWLSDGEVPALAPTRAEHIDRIIRLGLDLDVVARFCASKGKPHPDEMPLGQLAELVKYAESAAGAAALHRFGGGGNANGSRPAPQERPVERTPEQSRDDLVYRRQQQLREGAAAPAVSPTTPPPAESLTGIALIRARKEAREQIRGLAASCAPGELGEVCEMVGTTADAWEDADITTLRALVAALAPARAAEVA